MRILVLSDKPLSRRLGDGLRALGLYTPLCARHRFDLLCFARPGDTTDADAAEVFSSIQTLPFPTREIGKERPVRRWRRRLSIANFKAHSPPMTAEIARRIASRDYDVVLDVSANMLLNVPDCPLPVPLVVDSIDEPLLRDLRALRTVAWRDRAWLAYRAWMFWCYERALLGAATQNIYASELDAATYRRFFPNRPAAVVPNGVDIRYFSPADDRTDPSTIIFEGNMMFGANVDAARHLVHNVLPRLLRRVPDARIVLVGRDPAPQVQALASDRVAVTGTVADIRPYLARATVFACPMRLGSGIKNKILQAWAMARPVVTSTAGLGGLAARDGDNVLVRDAPDDFAAALACVIEDGDLAARLGKAGRNTVEREYSWEYRAAQFERLLQDAVQSHGTRVVGRDAPVAAPGSPAKSAPRMTPHV